MTRDDWLSQFEDELKKLRPHDKSQRPQTIPATEAIEVNSTFSFTDAERGARRHPSSEQPAQGLHLGAGCWSCDGSVGRASGPVEAE
jgi:hypothetical protein